MPSGVPHLVLADVALPGGASGVDLALELRGRRPELPIVLMTGYSQDVHEVKRRLGGTVQVLAKPFGEGVLGRAIQEGLGRGAGRDPSEKRA
jgi:FixJ family two-component response regulator